MESIRERFRERWLAEDTFVLGAFDGETLVGTARLFRENFIKTRHKGTIGGMYVAPEVRGKGMGRALLEEVVRRAEQVPGLKQLHLSVVTENEAARALYLACGFEIYGTEPRALKLGERYLDEAHLVRFLSG